MFGLKYLNRDKKLLLSKAEARLTQNKDPKVRNNTELLIQEILAEAKPYLDCDTLEASELRDDLANQIRVLEGLGKYQSAESFRMHLKDVDFHLQTLYLQQALKESVRPHHAEQSPNLSHDRMPSLAEADRERVKKRKKAMGRARWTVDME